MREMLLSLKNIMFTRWNQAKKADGVWSMNKTEKVPHRRKTMVLLAMRFQTRLCVIGC